MLHLTRNLNRRFDQGTPKARLDELGIPLERKAGRLSGGQQAQLALTLALARRPRLLVLDEPMAMLDPIARHDFMATVLAAAADDGVSVVLSSHVLAELERVADYLVLLSRGPRAGGRRGRRPARRPSRADRPGRRSRPLRRTATVVHARRGEAQAHLLVRTNGADDPVPPGWEAHPVGLEELVLAYLREPGAAALPGPARGRERRTVGGGAMTALPCPRAHRRTRACGRCPGGGWPGSPGANTASHSPAWPFLGRGWRCTCGSSVGKCTTPTPLRSPATRPARSPA